MQQNLVGWQWVSGGDANYLKDSPEKSGYNIYAPVMYKVANSLEIIKNFSGNITLARQRGYRVWLTIQQFGTMPNLSDAIIEEIIDKSLRHSVEGINIDFEGMGESNRDSFTGFIRKLYARARENKLTLSVDVVRPAVSLYSLCYDRKALSECCDYLVLMAYDQHWATSQVEGPVASLPWTEDCVVSVLNEGVPAEKLMLAVPFYSRNWKIKYFQGNDTVLLNGTVNLRSGPSTSYSVLYTGIKDEDVKFLDEVYGEEINGNRLWYKVNCNGRVAFVSAAYSTRLDDGKIRRVVSSAIGLQAGLDIEVNYCKADQTSRFGNTEMFNVNITFDTEAGQKLVTYYDAEGNLNKIWLEDFQSLAKRYALVNKYKLPGLAAWSLEWADNAQKAWRELK